MHSFRSHWLTYVLGAILVAFAAFIFLNPKPAKAGGLAELELSTGLGLADDQLKSSGTKIDFSQTGAVGGIGLGYTYTRADGFFIGAAGRFNLMHVVGDVGGANLKSDQLWETYAKVGRCWHTSADKCKYAFFALAGWSWMNLDLKDVGLNMTHPQGPMAGGGIDAHLTGPLYLRTEYAWHGMNGINAGGTDKLNPDIHVVRAALSIQFGETGRVPVVDDILAPPCDPKAFNCPKPSLK